MAKTLSSGTFSKGVIREIYGPAYKMQYEGAVARHLAKKIGQGQKGNMYKFEYFDPTTFSTAASVLTETNDFTTTTALTNASVIVYASEFGIRTDLTDRLRESGSVDFKAEAARQHGIAVAYGLENHILNAMSSGFVTGTITGTNSTNGFTYAKIMAAKVNLDAKLLTVAGRKHLVQSPYAWYYTAQGTYSTTYASAMGDLGNEVLKKFYVTSLFGDVDIYNDNFVTASSLAVGFMFNSDALGLWMPRDFRLEGQRDASSRSDELVSTLVAGAKVLVAGYGVRLIQYAKAAS